MKCAAVCYKSFYDICQAMLFIDVLQYTESSDEIIFDDFTLGLSFLNQKMRNDSTFKMWNCTIKSTFQHCKPADFKVSYVHKFLVRLK